MKYIYFTATILLLLTSSLTSICQESKLNPLMLQLATQESTPHWIYFKEELKLSPENFFEVHKDAFGLRDDDEMKMVRVDSERNGSKHFRYQQYYKRIKVLGGEYILHVSKEGYVYCANGKMPIKLNLTVTPSINKNEIISQALNAVNSKSYMWESGFWQDELKEKTHNPDTSYYPTPQLIVFKKTTDDNWDSGNFCLAFLVDIYPERPKTPERFFFDANTGEFLNKLPLESNCNSASVNTIFDGTRTIATNSYLYLTYRLKNDCQTASTRVRDWNSSSSSFPPIFPLEITSSSNTWISPNQQTGATLLWAVDKSREYFLNEHGRNSYDAMGGVVEAYINVPGTLAAMSNPPGSLILGPSSTSSILNSWCTLDIIGHEYTHAVVSSASNLAQSTNPEAGALNESFSDIFGEVIEKYVTNSTDYMIGGQRPQGFIRSLSNPNLFTANVGYSHPCPDTYLSTQSGASWCFGGSQCDAIHDNAGVQNFWFYLLCEGGFGTNDFGYKYFVDCIGMDKAAAIAYWNLTVYLTSASTYSDSKAGSIQSAIDLYGPNSPEVFAVRCAWSAVGMDNLYSFGPQLTSGVGTDTQTVCNNNPMVNITYSAVGATSVSVTGLPNGVVYNFSSNILTISGTPTTTGIFNYTISFSGNCGFLLPGGQINVSVPNTIVLSSQVGSDSQTVCTNNPIINITYNTTGATGATITGLPIGVTGTWVANVVTISGTPTSIGTYNYLVVLNAGCNNGSIFGKVVVTGPNNVLNVDLGESHSVYLCSGSSTPKAKGSNNSGQLGNGTNSSSTIPVQCGLNAVVKISGGGSHTLYLKTDGTVWASGSNTFGQLGDGTTIDRNTPVQVNGLNNIISINAGTYHSIFLKSNGTVWACGRNYSGQLGDGTNINRNIPIQIHGFGNIGFLTGVIYTSCGTDFSFFIKNDGTVWACGWNSNGQLGDGTVSNRNTPIQVHGFNNIGFLTGVVSVDAGFAYSVFLKNNGTVWAVGLNNFGQLGDGTNTQRTTPIQVHGNNNIGFLTGVSAISCGHQHSIFLKTDGSVVTCGLNTSGQLGDATTINRATPVPVHGINDIGFLTDVISISGGGLSTCLTKSDSTVWGCGSQFGGGTVVSSSGFSCDFNNSTPTITATINPIPCIGGSTILTAPTNNLNNALVWKWYTGYCGGTLIGVGSSITVFPTTNTTYYVRGEGNCLTPGICANINIVVNPVIVSTTTTNSSVCAGSPTTISANGANNYIWQPGGLTITTITVSPLTTTVYTVTGTHASGCTSTATRTITTLPTPNMVVTANPSNICPGMSSTLIANNVNTHLWQPGGQTTPSITVSPSATSTYTVTGTIANGCSQTVTKTVVVTTSSGTITASASSMNICQGSSTTLSAYGAYSYYWTPGGFSGNQIFVSPTSTTTYTVTGYNSLGCLVGSTQIVINVNAIPDVNASLSSSPICAGNSTTISANGAIAYNWQPGNLIGSAITVAPIVTTIYTVTGTTNACSSQTTLTVVVEDTTQTNSWTLKTNTSSLAKYNAVGFELNGKAYFGTGFNSSSNPSNDFWAYDPLTNTWMQKANYPGGVRANAIGFSINGKGYLGTGQDVNYIPTSDFWEYDPITNLWSQKANLPDSGGRYAAVAFSINGKGYVITGSTRQYIPSCSCYSTYSFDFTNKVYEYDPVTNTWTQKNSFPGGLRNHAVGLCINNKGYVGTGEYISYYKDFWEYDPITDQWAQKASVPGLSRRGAIGFGIGNKGYLGYGETNFNVYANDFWEYNSVTNTWSSKSSSIGSRTHGNGFSVGNNGYAGYGYSFSNGVRSDFWKFNSVNSICPTTTLNLNSLIQGYWDGSNNMVPALANQGQPTNYSACDTINISVRNSSPPYNPLWSKKTVLNQSGGSSTNFPLVSGNYYLSVKHRNSIETWSATPISLNQPVTSYDFTTAANTAYGSNQVQVGVNKWAFFSGDINQDNSIDAFDYLLLDPDIISGNGGYLNTDLNGDGTVDAFDYLILDPNVINGIGLYSP
jgi:Zn-dependent metalloprotease/alpha-tubulin suppressor-like RCC1 family protein